MNTRTPGYDERMNTDEYDECTNTNGYDECTNTDGYDEHTNTDAYNEHTNANADHQVKCERANGSNDECANHAHVKCHQVWANPSMK